MIQSAEQTAWSPHPKNRGSDGAGFGKHRSIIASIDAPLTPQARLAFPKPRPRDCLKEGSDGYGMCSGFGMLNDCWCPEPFLTRPRSSSQLVEGQAKEVTLLKGPQGYQSNQKMWSIWARLNPEVNGKSGKLAGPSFVEVLSENIRLFQHWRYG